MIYYQGKWQESDKHYEILHLLTTGQAIFETILFKDHTLWFWERHEERLCQNLRKFGCKYGNIDFRDIILRAGKFNYRSSGHKIKLVVTIPFENNNIEITTDSIIILTEALDQSAHSGENRLLTTPSPFTSSQPLIFVKSINYGAFIYCAEKARQQGFNDVLFLNSEGNLLETSVANIFAVKSNRIYTPAISDGLLPGVIRSLLVEYFDVRDAPIPKNQISSYDYFFTTNSVREIQPVTGIDDSCFEADQKHFQFVINEWENIKNRYRLGEIS